VESNLLGKWEKKEKKMGGSLAGEDVLLIRVCGAGRKATASEGVGGYGSTISWANLSSSRMKEGLERN